MTEGGKYVGIMIPVNSHALSAWLVNCLRVYQLSWAPTWQLQEFLFYSVSTQVKITFFEPCWPCIMTFSHYFVGQSVTVRAYFPRRTFVKLPFRSNPCKASSWPCFPALPSLDECSALGFQGGLMHNKSLYSYLIGLLWRMKMIIDEM